MTTEAEATQTLHGGRLVARRLKAYGVTKDEAERQLNNWQRNLAVEYDETEIVLDEDEQPEETRNGRG